MRLFELNRVEDESGVSGTGVVAQGVEFDNGKCALSWLTKVSSVAVYDSIENLEAIHGHNGKTKIVWISFARIVERVQRMPLYLPDDEDNA